MQVTAGPDGYLATTESADYRLQSLLAQYLSDRQANVDSALESTLSRLRKTLSKKELVGIIRAIHDRIGWHAAHEAELADGRRWQGFLAQLCRNLYAPTLPFTEGDLIALLEGHRKHSALWSFGPEPLLGAYLEAQELSPALAGELRRYQADLAGESGAGKFQNQAGYQSAVQQVHMMLWWDQGDPLDPAQCWSDRVRGDLRQMSNSERASWQPLLRLIKGNSPAKPSRSWEKAAELRLAQVGADEFRDRFRAWFAPFATDEPQRLSVAGSYVLRGLLWYAALSRDTALVGPALALLDAKWKSKRNIDKAMVALTAILEMLPSTEAWPWLLRLHTQWGTTSGQVERLLKKTAAERGVSEEELLHQGVLKPKPDAAARAQKIMEQLSKAGPIFRRRD